MIERGSGGVITVASTAGMQPLPYETVYSASKAFALNFSDALHAELRGTGVRCHGRQPRARCRPSGRRSPGSTSRRSLPGKIGPEQVVRESLARLRPRRALAGPRHDDALDDARRPRPAGAEAADHGTPVPPVRVTGSSPVADGTVKPSAPWGRGSCVAGSSSAPGWRPPARSRSGPSSGSRSPSRRRPATVPTARSARPTRSGIRLPEGFTAREIARGGRSGRRHRLRLAHLQRRLGDLRDPRRRLDPGLQLGGADPVPPPDRPAVGNPGDGGASAIKFSAEGEIESAYRILSGTSTNCAGGPTPWGTWLSCEETDDGRVWECDPHGEKEAVVHDALGRFTHEAICVDRRTGFAYLSEDDGNGCFYRFRPARKGDLSEGVLEVAAIGEQRHVRWLRGPGSERRRGRRPATRSPRRPASSAARGSGSTAATSTSRRPATAGSGPTTRRKRTMRVIYDGERARPTPPLTDVDNITIHEPLRRPLRLRGQRRPRRATTSPSSRPAGGTTAPAHRGAVHEDDRPPARRSRHRGGLRGHRASPSTRSGSGCTSPRSARFGVGVDLRSHGPVPQPPDALSVRPRRAAERERDAPASR